MLTPNPSPTPKPELDPFYRWDRLLYSGWGLVSVGLGVFLLATGTWLNGINAVLFGAVWVGFVGIRRRWVRSGYREGHWEAMDSALEARRRGLDLGQWLISEQERERGADLLPHPDIG